MKNQCYSPEFRAEAAKLVLEQGLSQEAAAKRRSIPTGTIGNWIVAAKCGGEVAAPGACSVSELEAENARLRKELSEARLERDILKKRRRTLPRSRCQVRVHDTVAEGVCHRGDEPGVGRLPQRLLRLASPRALGAGAGRTSG